VGSALYGGVVTCSLRCTTNNGTSSYLRFLWWCRKARFRPNPFIPMVLRFCFLWFFIWFDFFPTSLASSTVACWNYSRMLRAQLSNFRLSSRQHHHHSPSPGFHRSMPTYGSTLSCDNPFLRPHPTLHNSCGTTEVYSDLHSTHQRQNFISTYLLQSTSSDITLYSITRG
jgi:hypothetical protein